MLIFGKSQISPLIFFSSEKELFSWTYLLKKDTTKDKNINVSSLKEDFKIIRDAFWAYKYRDTIQQKLIQNFLQQEVGAFGNNIGKEPQKLHPKLKNLYIISLLRIFALQSNKSSSFLQKYINFVKSIIP